MVDYSKAQSSKAAKEAFDSTADSLIKGIQDIKEEHNVEWEIEEEYRKGRAAIIESVKPILKANDVKLEKPLDRCNHEELMAELRQVADSLPYEAREEIEVAMVRIDGRYTQIQEQAKKLDALNEKLAKFHLPEKDYDQEVVISFEDLKKSRSSQYEKNAEPKEKDSKTTVDIPETKAKEEAKKDPDLEEVVDITKADEELLDSFDELVQTEITINSPHIIEESDITIPNLEEDDEDFTFDDAFDSLFNEEAPTGDDASLMEEFLDNQEEMMPEEADYQVYELKEDQTLSQIVDYVYEGKLTWYDIYLYGNNKGMIDRKCAELNMDPEDAAYTEGALTGISVEYPKNFITYQGYKREDKEEKGYARAA